MLEEAIRMCDRTNRIQRKLKMKEKLGHDRKAEGRKCQRRLARGGGGWRGGTDGWGRTERGEGEREGRRMWEGRGKGNGKGKGIRERNEGGERKGKGRK